MSMTQLWNPATDGCLEGWFRDFGGLVTGIEADDGTFWLLDARAEALLRAQHPQEAQRVQVTFHGRSTWRASTYDVTLR